MTHFIEHSHAFNTNPNYSMLNKQHIIETNSLSTVNNSVLFSTDYPASVDALYGTKSAGYTKGSITITEIGINTYRIEASGNAVNNISGADAGTLKITYEGPLARQ